MKVKTHLAISVSLFQHSKVTALEVFQDDEKYI